MATKIVTKNSSTAGAAPTATDLVQGELAVNVADKRLYTEDNVGGIVELGTNPSAEIVANGGIALPDNGKATFGAGDDLQIYHDGPGNHSYITESGTGDFFIQGNNLIIENTGGENYFRAVNGGAVQIYYSGSEKLATTATGIDVTGTATMDGLTVDGDGTLQTLDGAILKLRTTDTSALANDIAGAIYFETDDPSRTQGTRNSIESILLGGQANTRLKFKSSQDDGALLTRMDIDSNGDISFYEDTGTTAKLFWDASAESLGIGTSSPSAALDLGNGDLRFTGGAGQDIVWGSASVDYAAIRRIDPAAQDVGLAFHTTTNAGSDGAPERMRIDSAGNLLVGTTDSFPVGGGDTTAGIALTAGGNIYAQAVDAVPMVLSLRGDDGVISLFRKNGLDVGSIGTRASLLKIGTGDVGLLFNSASDAILPENIDGGAGRSDAIDLGVAGAKFKDLYLSGEAKVTSTGVDGTYAPILRGVYSGNAAETNTIETTVSSNASISGFKFNVSNGGGSSGQTEALKITRDGTYAPFGIKLGGTGAANKLDDYEEGTFTPTVIGSTTAGTATYSQQKGVYTKIGNVVTVQIYLNWTGGTGAGVLRFSSLPFTLYSTSGFYASPAIGEYSSIAGTAGHTLCGIGLPNTVDIQFAENDFNSAPTTTTYDAGGYIILSMTYTTA